MLDIDYFDLPIHTTTQIVSGIALACETDNSASNPCLHTDCFCSPKWTEMINHCLSIHVHTQIVSGIEQDQIDDTFFQPTPTHGLFSV